MCDVDYFCDIVGLMSRRSIRRRNKLLVVIVIVIDKKIKKVLSSKLTIVKNENTPSNDAVNVKLCCIHCKSTLLSWL